MAKFVTINESLPAFTVKGETVPARNRQRVHGFMTIQELCDYTERDAVQIHFNGKTPEVTGSQREETESWMKKLSNEQIGGTFEQKEIILWGGTETAKNYVEKSEAPNGEKIRVKDGGHRISAYRRSLEKAPTPEWKKAFASLAVPVQFVMDGDEFEIFHRHNQARKATRCMGSVAQSEDADSLMKLAGCFNRAGLLKGQVVFGDAAGKGVKYTSLIERNALSGLYPTMAMTDNLKVSATKLEGIIKATNESVTLDVTTTAGKTLFLAAVNIVLIGMVNGIDAEVTYAKFAAADWDKCPAGTSAQAKREACLWMAKTAFNGKHMDAIGVVVELGYCTLGAFGLKKPEAE